MNAKRAKALRKEADLQAIGKTQRYTRRLYRKLKRATRRGEKTVWLD